MHGLTRRMAGLYAKTHLPPTGKKRLPGAYPLCVFAHISPPDLRLCCDDAGNGDEIMKRSTFSSRKLLELPIAWCEAEYAALQAEAGDAGDDRVSENIFDVADERAEVDIIVHGMIRGVN